MENLEKKQSVEVGQESFNELISSFPIYARIELMQLVNGLRPVAQITVMPKFKDTMAPGIDSLMGLGFAVAQRERDRGIAEYFISHDQKLADEALETEDPKRFGELMGFPESSIAAFLNKEGGAVLEEGELARMIGFENHCFHLRLSKGAAEDEIDYLRKSYKVLLEQAPQLIDAMLPVDVDADEFKKKVAVFVYGQETI